MALVALCLLLSARTARAQETIEYYGVDALGSIRVVFDQTGAVTARSDYLPFGESYAPFGNLPPQRFTGQQRDADEGFDYFNARNLQTRTGRFGRLDPVFSGSLRPQAWNRYSYVSNNPLRFTDPTGMNAENPGARSCWFGIVPGCHDWGPAWDALYASGGVTVSWSWRHWLPGGIQGTGGADRGTPRLPVPETSQQEQKRAPDIPKTPPLPEITKPPVESPPPDQPCQATWTNGSPTLFAGGTINLTAIGGGELTAGIYVNLGMGTSRRALGGFASAGGSVGLNLSAGVTFGINKGDFSYLSGDALEFSAGTVASGTAVFNGTGFAGASLTKGLAYPVVLSFSRTVTTLAEVHTGSVKDCK